MNRYRALSGVDQYDWRTYIDVAQYRNILDLLNVIEGIARHIVYFYAPRILKEASMLRGFQDVHARQHTSYDVRGPIYGYGVNLAGKSQSMAAMRAVFEELAPLAQQALNAAGPSSPQATGNILDEARQLEWMMNQVYLPLPLNFRQLADRIQQIRSASYWMRWTTNDKNGVFNTDSFQELGRTAGNIIQFSAMNKKVELQDDGGMVTLAELLRHVVQMFPAIAAIRAEVRREIDAADHHNRVREETLRNEQEAFLAAQEAEAQAIAEAARILREREEQYSGDIVDALRLLYHELTPALVESHARVEQLQAAIAEAESDEEFEALYAEYQAEAARANQLSAQIDAAYERAGVLIDAVKNLDSQNAELRAQAQELELIRNQIKSEDIRELEKMLNDAQAQIVNRRVELERELRWLEEQRLIAEQQAMAEELSRIEEARAAAQAELDALNATAASDQVAQELARQQQAALDAINALLQQQTALQSEIDAMNTRLLELQLNPDQNAGELQQLEQQLAALRQQQQGVAGQLASQQNAINQTKKAAQSLDENLSKITGEGKAGGGWALPVLFGVLALLGT